MDGFVFRFQRLEIIANEVDSKLFGFEILRLNVKLIFANKNYKLIYFHLTNIRFVFEGEAAIDLLTMKVRCSLASVRTVFHSAFLSCFVPVNSILL